jgi:hypothetical protein
MFEESYLFVLLNYYYLISDVNEVNVDLNLNDLILLLHYNNQIKISLEKKGISSSCHTNLPDHNL